MSAATAGQIKAIHSGARAAGLDEDARRDLIAQIAGGKRSTKELDGGEAARIIDRLQSLAPAGGNKPKAAGALNLRGAYVPVCRALWISGYHLGVIHDRTDRALCAFAERQTGITTLAWVREAKHGTAVIQALRDMLRRDAGVDWPLLRRGTAAAHGIPERIAVIEAQCRRLGLPRPHLRGADAAELNAEIAANGREIRSRAARAKGGAR